ncbi:3-hydroxyacyl-CoA dehydrogenase family protein [Plantactinospora sp. S1510]|uniref:3-hydroxyacyl-CoA dehydrogenase family protein n=1 Tax=Plantactinospora alkalitolerans TaxID=2789879 RepID=A0ABS0GTK2_9ACTN|nr:3-hydroxyacyl-CoA dehydrogenase family protein [Plantactinospora alkalitolerans]MBF9129510.1 3-hydroxyacyl-CoA dehydrogenase family protein [Plantactinospora alkalitolerans]
MTPEVAIARTGTTLPVIGVVGAGQMGVGVGQCFAEAGHPVTVVEPSASARASVSRRLVGGLRLSVLGGRKGVDFDEVISRIRCTADLDDLRDAAFVVECAPERTPLKEDIFRRLGGICPTGTVLASCTSAIPIARLGAASGRPDRVLGTHLMNPAPIKRAVEVVTAPDTSPATLRSTVDLLRSIGKEPIVVGDAPGFVTNRVLMLMINEAAAVVREDTATPAVVDKIFQECFGHPTGPLATADLIGLDTVVDTLAVLLDHTGDARFVPCPLLVELVDAGRTGRKSGAGFHTY